MIYLNDFLKDDTGVVHLNENKRDDLVERLKKVVENHEYVHTDDIAHDVEVVLRGIQEILSKKNIPLESIRNSILDGLRYGPLGERIGKGIAIAMIDEICEESTSGE